MTAASVASEVEVGIDPTTAFEVFTEEIDLWWLRGPINNWDSARVVEMRCEPGVGGRLLEIYDEAAGDMLEIARITAWEPGRGLSWQSSLDEVRIEVRFEASDRGCRVRVEATIPPGGRDAGGTSFVRVSPPWFAAWSARRDRVPRELRDAARLAIAVYYSRPAEAARWLRDVFGFEPILELPEADGDRGWIEFRIGNCSLMLFPREDGSSVQPPNHVPWVFVDDLDAHLATARRAGARIVEGIHQHGYRAYTADDLEGRRWVFAQARPTM